MVLLKVRLREALKRTLGDTKRPSPDPSGGLYMCGYASRVPGSEPRLGRWLNTRLATNQRGSSLVGLFGADEAYAVRRSRE